MNDAPAEVAVERLLTSLRTSYWLLLLLLLSAVLLRVPAFFQPTWYMDEGIFAAVATEWRDGATLYAETWDNKPPAIFAVYLAGWATGLEMVAVRLMDLAAMLGVIVLVFAMARRQGGTAAGLIGATVVTLVLGLPLIEGNIANTESFLILFTALGMFLLQRRLGDDAPFAAFALPGIAFGAGCLFKQVGLLDAMAAATFIALVYRANLRPLLAFGAGLAMLPLVVAALFLVWGNFGDLWHATVTSLAGYSGDSPDRALGDLAVALLPLAIALPYAIATRPWRTKSGTEHEATQDGADVRSAKSVEALFPLWLAFTAIAVASSGRSYPHYLIQMVPPFALVVAMIASTYRPRLPRASVATGMVVAALAVYHVILGPLGWVAWNKQPEYTRDYYENFIEYASGDIDRDEHDWYFGAQGYAHLKLFAEIRALDLEPREAFIWGALPWLYSETNLTNPTRYSTLFNAEEVEGSTYDVALLLREVKPQYIIVLDEARESWAEVEPILSDEYAALESFDFAVVLGRQPPVPVDPETPEPNVRKQ